MSRVIRMFNRDAELVDATCWDTSTPGIVIVQTVLTDGRVEDTWQLLHEPSGIGLGLESASPENAMRMASACAQSDELFALDWTVSALAIQNDPRYKARRRTVLHEMADLPGGGRYLPATDPRLSAIGEAR